LATSSGIVLDFYTNYPIEGATILLGVSGTMPYSSAVSSPIGTFTLSSPSDPYAEISTLPIKIGYIGYSSVLSNSDSFITLYLREEIQERVNISGVGNLNFFESTLVTGQKINDIKASPYYIFVATVGGLDIVEINTLKNVGYIKYDGGISCISLNKNYSNDSEILLGTSNSGVVYFSLPYTWSGRNLSSRLRQKWSATQAKLTSNYVTCIDQTISGEYLIGTNSGIDYYNISGTRYKHEYGMELNTDCCKISEFNDLYYSPRESGVYIKYGTPLVDWTFPDYTVTLSGTGSYPFPLLSNKINDIDLKSVSGSNSVFIASLSGLLYYDENRFNLDATASGAILITNYP